MTKFRNSRSEAFVQPFHFQKGSKVQPQFAYDCDINNIVAGMAAPLPSRPISDDSVVKTFSPDMYERALYVKAEAESAFYELPSKVRTFFENNPKNMLEFISKPENAEKCVELGLMVRDSEKQFKTDLLDAIKSSKTVETVTPKESVGD